MRDNSFDAPDDYERVAAALRLIPSDDIRNARSEGGSCLAISRIVFRLNGGTWNKGEEQHFDECSICRARLGRLFMSWPKQTSAAMRLSPTAPPSKSSPLPDARSPRQSVLTRTLQLAIAACLLVAISLVGYRVGRNQERKSHGADLYAESLKLQNEKEALNKQLVAKDQKLGRLEAEASKKEHELEGLLRELQTDKERVSELTSEKNGVDLQLQAATQERDTLNEKLRKTEQANRRIQAELDGVKGEQEQATLQLASLDTKVKNLLEEKGRMENYLAADRDIRELMGDRQLYVANISDVLSGGETRKPFARVFYTKDKSLRFYGFDLDQQPHVTEASRFEVWGKSKTAPNQPMKLGVLYEDSKENRRWVLRCDDPKLLAEIDAVFVTVEPNERSNKPTGKAFLSALLHEEPNHP